MSENENHCYFDKKGIWHECNRTVKDCDGCEYEHVIARTLCMLCHYCGKEIIANKTKAFCNENCRNRWLSARMCPDNLVAGCVFWTEGYGLNCIQTEEELRECHNEMGIT